MNTIKNVLALLVVAVMFFGCAHGEKWVVQDTFQITPTARIVAWQQGASKTWYGGAVQGGQALVQLIPKGHMIREKIKLEWYRQTGKCPLPEQITKVEKGWNEFLIWAEGNIRYEETVQIISTFSHPLQAPGPIILSAIVKAVADGASGVLGPWLFAKTLRPTEVSQNVSGVSSTGPVSAATGPICNDNTNINNNNLTANPTATSSSSSSSTSN